MTMFRGPAPALVCLAAIWGSSPVLAGESPAGAGPAAVAPSSFRFVDARPKDERKTKTLSLLITNCDFGVVRVAEPVFGKMPAALERRLNEALGAKLAGREVILDHELVWFNGASIEASMTAGVVIAGPLGALIPPTASTTAPRCEREKMTGGWFDPAELTNQNSPFIVEISVRIDGKPYSVRTVYSPAFQLSRSLINAGFPTGAKEAIAVGESLDKGVVALIAAIDAGLPEGVAPPAA